MEYKIVSAGSPNELTTKVNERLKDGWEILGPHQVVIHREQKRYSGMQHMDTLNQLEYSQTMCRKTEENVIKVDISFYHPDNDETTKVYDEEGMREEFENKLQQIVKDI